MSLMLPFVGRDEDLSLLTGALNGALAGRPLLLLLEGEPGIGKSALLARFREELRRSAPRRLRVLDAAVGESGAYDPLGTALGAGRGDSGSAPAGADRTRELTRQLLPEWLGAIPVWGELMAAVTETADAIARRRAVIPGLEDDDTLSALVRAARRRPIAVLLDDVERATAAGIGRLERLITAAPAGSRLLVVATHRPVIPGRAAAPIHGLVARMRSERVLHHTLAPLSPPETAAWAGETFAGAEIAMAVVERVHELTGGHPADLVGLVRTGALAPEGDSLRLDETLAIGVLAADVTGVLERLGPDVSEVVRSATALGLRFEAAALADRLSRDEARLEDDLSLAAHFGILAVEGETEGPDGLPTTVYRFRSTRHMARLAPRG